MFFNFGGIPFTGGGGGGPEMFFEDGGASFNAPPPPNPDEDYYKTLGVDEKATDDELKKSLASSHIFPYPSTYRETFCLALLEAMSAGLLCVHPNYA